MLVEEASVSCKVSSEEKKDAKLINWWKDNPEHLLL